MCSASSLNYHSNIFFSLFIELKISHESYLLTQLGKIFDDRYMVLRGIFKAFITKERFPESRHFYFEKDQKKNYLPFRFSVYFFQIIGQICPKRRKTYFSTKLSKKPPDSILHIPCMMKNNIQQILNFFFNNTKLKEKSGK